MLRGLGLLAKSENFWGVSARARIGEPTLENPIERRAGNWNWAGKKETFLARSSAAQGEFCTFPFLSLALRNPVIVPQGF